MLLARGVPDLRRCTAYHGFNGVKLRDVPNGGLGDLLLRANLTKRRRRRACHVQNSFRVILLQLSSRLGTPRFLRADQPPIQPLEQGWNIAGAMRITPSAIVGKRTCNLRDACALTLGPFAAEPVETKHLLRLRREPIMATASAASRRKSSDWHWPRSS